MTYQELGSTQVAAAALLMLLNGVVSMALQLRLERSLLFASVRTVLQLLLIGFVLHWVFEVESPWVVCGIMLFMTAVAGLTAYRRSETIYRGMLWDTLLAVACSSWIIVAYAITTIFAEGRRWYDPQYVIPVLGMILGNTLNGITLGLSTVLDKFQSQRDQIETVLALGGTRWEAARPALRQANHAGMTPIINSMMVVGLVSLPGMMTGQLLSGVQPIEAVKYQMVIMFLIASATALGVVGVTLLSYHRLFDRWHRFRADRVSKR